MSEIGTATPNEIIREAREDWKTRQPKKRKRLEGDLQKLVLAYLAHRRVFCYRMNTGKMTVEATDKAPAFGGSVKRQARHIYFGIPGQADVTGILPDGIRLEIETKAPKKKQSPAQISFQKRIEENGGIYVLADDWDRFKARIDGLLAEHGKNRGPKES